MRRIWVGTLYPGQRVLLGRDLRLMRAVVRVADKMSQHYPRSQDSLLERDLRAAVTTFNAPEKKP